MIEPPSIENLISILCKCRTCRDLHAAKYVHVRIHDYGLETHTALGNYLVPMLVDCGSLHHAQQAFSKLLLLSEHAWTSLIQGCVDNDAPRGAIFFYSKMQKNFVQPSVYTFAALLRACTRLKDLTTAMGMHVDLIKQGFDSDISVGNTLVDMYGIHGSLMEARDVFGKLSVRDVVSWNVLISHFGKQGRGKQLLECLEHMALEHLSPDDITFLWALKACGSLGAIVDGHEVHVSAVMHGFDRDLYVSNSLVDMYVKCGSLEEAQTVFNSLPIQNSISWRILIAGYHEKEMDKEVLSALEKMEESNVLPFGPIYVLGLQACAKIRDIFMGHKLHSWMVKFGLENDLYAGNTLVDMYSKFGLLGDAKRIFNLLPARTEVSWTALIASYSECGLLEEVHKCLEQMQMEGVCLDCVSLVCCLKAWGGIRAVERIQSMHYQIVVHGFDKDIIAGNSLVDTYARCGMSIEAECTFWMLPAHNVVACNGIIAGYIDLGCGEKALTHFFRLHAEGICPDKVTFICSLKAVGMLGILDLGRELHAEIVADYCRDKLLCNINLTISHGRWLKELYNVRETSEGLESGPLNLQNTLIDMYGKCGSIIDAQAVFYGSEIIDLVSWNVMIAGLARQGKSELVFKFFNMMIEDDVQPDEITVLHVLTLCSHVGLVFEGRKFLKAIDEMFKAVVQVEHHNTMVDLLCRAGQVDESMELLERMPFQPTCAAWISILSVCRMSGNVAIARQIFENGIEFECDAGAFVLMSNIYMESLAEC